MTTTNLWRWLTKPRLNYRYSEGRDHYFGPFLWAPRDSYCGPSWGVMLSSGDGDEYAGCTLLFQAAGHSLLIILPQWVLRPEPNEVKRQYGFSTDDGSVHWKWGKQGRYGELGRRSGVWFVPWLQWRYIQQTLFTPAGDVFAVLPGHTRSNSPEQAQALSESNDRLKKACPRSAFLFRDYDGKEITAVVLLEEMEWRRGEGWFKWMSLIVPHMVKRYIDIEFSEEVGPEKGSWKGGTLGHSGPAEGMTPEQAFRAYCPTFRSKYGPSPLTYLREVSAPALPDTTTGGGRG